MKALNHSRQRDAIYNFLLSTKEHPTAEVVFQKVQEEYPKISLGTVYRNLALLEEIGQVQKIPSFDSKDHYDADISEHPHFECRCCGGVYDVKMDNLDFLKTLAANEIGGEIEKTQVVFFGKCEKCVESENNS